MANKILFLLTSTSRIPTSQAATGLWIEEYADPYFALTDLGYSISTVSLAGGAVPIDPASWKPDGRQPAVLEKLRADPVAMEPLANAKSVSEVDPTPYAGLYIPGGHGTMWDLPNNPVIADLVQYFLTSDRPVAAICHGPAALIGVRDSAGELIVSGREVTAFSNAEEDFAGLNAHLPFRLQDELLAAGARYAHVQSFAPCVRTSGCLVTGQNPASSSGVIDEFVRCLPPKRH